MRNSVEYAQMVAKAIAGVGKNIFIKDFRHNEAAITAIVAGGAGVTIKAQASGSELSPDFSAAKSVTNQWDYADMIDLQDGTPIDGDTGIALTADELTRRIAVNADGGKWINFELSSITGVVAVTINTQLYND